MAYNPIFQNTLYEWVPSGRINSSQETEKLFCGIGTGIIVENNENVSKLLEKFWMLEEQENEEDCLMSISEQICKNHFEKHKTRNQNGQFIVNIP